MKKKRGRQVKKNNKLLISTFSMVHKILKFPHVLVKREREEESKVFSKTMNIFTSLIKRWMTVSVVTISCSKRSDNISAIKICDLPNQKSENLYLYCA